ncbi:MAG: TRAP transporter TatT component family protein [Woeseiaceae bacterium]|nr:TRAP transporter TatT component family protein [Woeseiaceae bacterium]
MAACLLPLLGGCASLVSNAASGFADNLSKAVLNQDDPETAKAAIPSYMVLIDSLIEGNPDDPDMLSAAAEMYASYGAVFADDEIRARRLTAKARRYALKAMCEDYSEACGWREMNFDEFEASVRGVTPKQADLLYTYGFTTLAYMRAHSSETDTLAELPQVETLFYHYLDIAGDSVSAATHTYMGILLTLRPPALGGKPDEAREHFERAIAMSDGRDLSAKVEYARGYAKLLYERELHDRLLNEVLAADPYADGLTLGNVMAQDDAKQLLAEADDYF